MTQQLHNMIRKLPRAHRQGRQVLDLRARIAAIRWLEWPMRWRDGRVYWQANDDSLFAPTIADFARSQYHLVKIARYRSAADILLGNSEVWIERRQQQLRIAQIVDGFNGLDLSAVALQARDGDLHASQRLVNMLVVEAVCVNKLPVSPAATLSVCGGRVASQVAMLVADETMPVAVRVLAVLVLGVLRRDQETLGFNATSTVDATLRRAMLWGMVNGLPDDPGFAAALLSGDDGSESAQRLLLAARSTASFRLPTKLMRYMLAHGVSVEQLVALDEAATVADYSVDLRRLHCLGRIIRVYRKFVQATADPEIILLITQLINSTLSLVDQVDLTQLVSSVVKQGLKRPVQARQIHLYSKLELRSLLPAPADTIRIALEDGLSLPSSLYRPYLALVVELHSKIWDREWLGGKQSARRISAWLQRCWASQGKALLILLQQTNDPALVRDAFELNIYHELTHYSWTRCTLRPWMFAAARALLSNDQRWQSHALWRTIQCFPNSETAHAVVRPFTDALVAAPAEVRAELLYRLLDELQDREDSIRDTLPRLMVYMPHILQLARTTKNASLCSSILTGLLLLDTDHVEQANDWCRWLVSFVSELVQQPEREVDERSVELGVLLAVALSDDLADFQAVGRVAIGYAFDQPWRQREQIRQGISMLGRLVGVQTPLRQLFPQQPKRCIELIMRLGMASRLGAETLEPLRELDPVGDDGYASVSAQALSDLVASEDVVWRQLLALVPDLGATAGAYVYAQWLRGSSLTVPAGVCHALEQPQKMARELAHIERVLASNPGRSDLRSRIANIRERLADTKSLLASVADEARDRLRQITAEAQLAAAELQLTACYRNRLRVVVGILPTDVVLDDDILNATLLTVDIDNNRRLLRQLLAAHIAGDREWREQIPGNAAFLHQLAERGVHRDVWLGEYRHRYRTRHVVGGYLTLHLEREPIHILQMGNYVDTCLSRGSINAFSTVTNACELNKRVIYATDAAGRVVGRKLIAISDEWYLVGFSTYTALDNEQSSATVGRIIRHYVERFAAACKLQLASYGEVPKLFAEEWYDDGIVEWGIAAPPSQTSVVTTT